MRGLRVFLMLIGSVGVAHPASANEPCDTSTGIRLTGTPDAPWTLQIQLNPKDVPLNVPFDAVVTVCSPPELLPVRLTVDATMPAHKHGMNYEPNTTQVEKHRFEVKNLLFHMPGIWRVEVTAYEKDKPYRFTHDVKLP